MATVKHQTHGKSQSKEYKTWQRIHQRCHNPKMTDYDKYGGRGIKVCWRWYCSFERFYEDIGDAPSKHHSIDRINTNGHYSPENCRWATKKRQARNKRNNNILIYKGEIKSIMEWSEETGLSAPALYCRKKRGWNTEKILTKPLQKVERIFSIFGLTLTLKDWAKLLNINYRTLNIRLQRGWSVSKAFITPVKN